MTAFGQCRNTAAPVVTKRWNPGVYLASNRTNNGVFWDRAGSGPGTEGVLQMFDADVNDRWRGVLLRFAWGKLRNFNTNAVMPDDFLEDDTLGSYDVGMDRIQNYLDTLHSSFPTKRILVFINNKTFGSTRNAVPLYVYNGTNPAYDDPDGFGNGQYAYQGGNANFQGHVANFHVAAVRNRFMACMTEFANRFKDHPALEGIVFSESSINRPIGSSGWDKTPWYNGMTDIFEDIRTKMPDLLTCQWINADRGDLVTWVPQLRAAGVGLGMTDLCPQDKGFNYRNDVPNPQNPGNIQHCQESNGLAMIMGHLSQPAYDGTVVDRCQTATTVQGTLYPAYPGVATSRQTVRDFAVNTVGVTHLMFSYNEGNQPLTGAIDPNIPAACADNPWTAYPPYAGQKYNVINTQWLNDPASNITTITTRPTGW